jgi:hypothetical protein
MDRTRLFNSGSRMWKRRAWLAVALVAAFAAPLVAYAVEDQFSTPVAITSTSGASAGAAVPGGTRLALQSQTCSFHYRACTSSSCSATQTDVYVAQYQLFDVQLTSDRKYIAVACDGTTTGVVYGYQVVLP